MLLDADKAGIGFSKPADAETEKASLLFMCVSTLLLIAVNVRIFGTTGAILVVLLAVGVLYLGRATIIPRLLRQPVLIMLPCFFVISCLWSDIFSSTLSVALQTLLSTIAALTIAQGMTHRQFLHSIFIATSVICIGCILHGGQGPSATGDVLIGFLGSKDAMGTFAYSAAMTSLAVMLDTGSSLKLRGLAFPLLFVETWIATHVNAATSVIAVGLGFIIFFSTYFILSKYRIVRWLCYYAIIAIVLGFIIFTSDFVDLFLYVSSNHLGKDSTLTGRTILWEQAIALFHDSPLVGHGYRGFWLGDSMDARRILESMNIGDPRGFNFHQQYLEILADTGIIGFTMLVTTLVVFARTIWKSVYQQRSIFTAYAFTILVIYYARFILETAFVPFSFDMMMVYGLAAAAMKRHAPDMKQ
ncbi:MAG: O-antigen ligase family protein [Rickettsiales bacterium]